MAHARAPSAKRLDCSSAENVEDRNGATEDREDETHAEQGGRVSTVRTTVTSSRGRCEGHAKESQRTETNSQPDAREQRPTANQMPENRGQQPTRCHWRAVCTVLTPGEHLIAIPEAKEPGN